MSSPPNPPAADLVERLVEVTGTSDAEAKHLLAACANDVEAAVALFFEGGSAGSAGTSVTTAPSLPVISDDSDGVRAPIAPIREQLIGPEDDNFFAAASPPTTGRLTRNTRRVKVCPLRDFAREGALMEEQLQAAGSYIPLENYESATHSRGSSRRDRAAAMVARAQAVEPKISTSRLGDLFRPPTDIAHAGTFQTARSRATALRHWLLVNVQSDNFDSQLLNRDVWSDKALRKLMKRQFLLWQVDSDSSEGRRFVTFYHCANLPYLCVIDPRTGEEVWKSAAPKQSTVLPDLQKFLREHKDFSQDVEDEMAPSTSKRPSTAICIDDDEEDNGVLDDEDSAFNASNSTPQKSSNPKKRNKLMELSEEEQIALAIRNSMKENGGSGGEEKSSARTQRDADDAEDDDAGSEFGSVEEFHEDDTKSACERISYEEQLGTGKNEFTMLKLRLLNAAGADEVVQLKWPSDTRVEVIRAYIAQTHAHIPKEGYKLICAFPRKTLEAEHDAYTLKEIGLHPSANLHITLND